MRARVSSSFDLSQLLTQGGRMVAVARTAASSLIERLPLATRTRPDAAGPASGQGPEDASSPPSGAAREPIQEWHEVALRTFIAVGVFSVFVNLLMLTMPIYLFQISDRVLTSRSMDTLL